MLDLDLSKLNSKDVLAVGISGGKDSVALISCLIEAGIEVKAINVEHGIRGQSSVGDSEFVKEFCRERKIEIKTYCVNAPKYCRENKLTLEEGARLLRYLCFQDAVASGFCTKIATAHHLSDSVETMLFNLFRGSGLKGLKGISDREYVIRPFKNVTKEQIESYIAEKNLPFVEDESNLDTDFSRNYIRREIVPKIKEQFPSFEKAMSRFACVCESADDYLEKQAQKYVEDKGEEISILPCDSAIFDYACIKALKRVGIKKDYEQKHLTMLRELCQKKNGSSVNLPKGLVAVVDYGKITIFSPTAVSNENKPFACGVTAFGDKKIYVGENFSGKGLKFDLDKIPCGAVLRTRQEGDTFKPFSSGTKKLKKYLIDKKIPSRKRDELVLVADKEKVLIIIGVEISELVKVDSDTKKIYYVGEDNV